MKKTEIRNVIDLAITAGKSGRGALFVVSDRPIRKYYSRLYGEFIKPFRISPRMYPVIEALESLDGAIIVSNNMVVDAGAKLKKTRTFPGHGTKHSAALGISSVEGVVSVLASEEDRMVRVFKNGKLIIEINPETGRQPSLLDKIAALVSKKDFQIIGTGGIASVALGLNPFVATLVFAGSYILTRYGAANIEEFMKTGKIVVKKKKKP